MSQLSQPIDLLEVAEALGRTVDLIAPQMGSVSAHGRQVAYTAMLMGREVGLSEQELYKLYLASLVHDIGVPSPSVFEKLENIEWEGTFEHGFKGAELLRECAPLAEISPYVLSHHDRWAMPNNSGLTGERIPLGSRIIFVVDRVAMFQAADPAPSLDEVISYFQLRKGTYFEPALVDLMLTILRRDGTWEKLLDPRTYLDMSEVRPRWERKCSMDDIYEFAKLLSRIVDGKSPYTASHCRGVATVARMLAERIGLGRDHALLIEIAALLHDLGKVAIPLSILHKPWPLLPLEVSIMRTHALETFEVLRSVKGFENLAKWAGFHHERLDGSGYPFRLTADQLPLESRLVAISDVFHALIEDRPHRRAYDIDHVREIISRDVAEGRLDGDIASILLGDLTGFHQAVSA